MCERVGKRCRLICLTLTVTTYFDVGQYGSNLTVSGFVNNASQTCRNRSSRPGSRGTELRISFPEELTIWPAVTARPQKEISTPSLSKGVGIWSFLLRVRSSATLMGISDRK